MMLLELFSGSGILSKIVGDMISRKEVLSKLEEFEKETEINKPTRGHDCEICLCIGCDHYRNWKKLKEDISK